MLAGPTVQAQQASDSTEKDENFDPMGGPSEYGLRFTPAMARGLSKEIIKNVFVRRYELDEAKTEQATELMSRRLMQFAHQNEEGGQELFEFFFSEMANRVAGNRGQDTGGLPREVMQGLGTRLLPTMPAIREVANGMVQDIRPMLGFKQQLKLTGEVAVMNVALDAFEKNMQSWSKGDADPFGDPFRSDEADLKKDENGETRLTRNAKSSAEAQTKAPPWANWGDYVEEAKKYYQLDPAQSEAADSVLREYQERAQFAVGGEADWHQRAYRNRVLCSMSASLRGRWGNPLRILLDADFARMREPAEALEKEMKERIEQIPTRSQRETAERRMLATLREKGLYLEEPVAATTQPAASPEAQP
jgi:hypothetical protein